MDKTTENIIKESQFLRQDIPGMDSKDLCKFGLMFAVIFSILFGLLLPVIFSYSIPMWPWIVAAVFLIISISIPQALAPFYFVWMRFGVIMNMIMSRIILGSVFLLTVIPTGIILRLRGKDILNLKMDNESPSYRIKSTQENIDNLKKPY